jgi:cytochrome c-type biogenesis protein CcmE
MKQRRLFYLFGVVLLLAFAGFAFTTFREGLTPYVSFDDARDPARTGVGRTLQVAGALVKGSSSYEDGVLAFTIQEPKTGKTLRVRYRGVKPANFEEAISVVAIGRYHADEEAVDADRLLVKCPSKYQGVEATEVKQYG